MRGGRPAVAGRRGQGWDPHLPLTQCPAPSYVALDFPFLEAQLVIRWTLVLSGPSSCGLPGTGAALGPWLSMGPEVGGDLAPRGHLARSGDTVRHHSWEWGALSIWWAGSGLLVSRGAQDGLHSREYVAPNAGGAEGADPTLSGGSALGFLRPGNPGSRSGPSGAEGTGPLFLHL